MRTFEVLLVLVNLLSLLPLLRKSSKVFGLLTGGVNLSVFLIHGIVEGFRYQMLFSYLFVAVLLLYALVNTRDTSHRARTPGVVKIVALFLSVVLLGITTFLAYALPVFSLPEPTGRHHVGIKYFHLVDDNRTEPFLDGSVEARELMIKVYYPAEEDRSKPFSPYFHGSCELLRLLTSGYRMPSFLFDHLSLVVTNSKEDLQLSDEQRRYPVVLFSHGAGTTMEVQTSQSEDLASHGYIVVAIDHPYVSAATVFPDRIVWSREATTDFDVAEPAALITQIMADDVQFVIDTLDEMNNGETGSIFQGRLDLERIGIMGHSVGGAVAYNLALNDSRVKAAIDLDGIVFVTPEGGPENVAPFLMLANDRYGIQAIPERRPLLRAFEEMPEEEQAITLTIYGSEEAYDELYETARRNMAGLVDVLQARGALFTIEGSDHMKFVDIGLFIGFRPLRELINIRGNTDPARCLEITKAVTLAFLDQYLKGESPVALDSLIEAYPELERIGLH